MVANLHKQTSGLRKKMVGKKSKQAANDTQNEFYQHYYANVAKEDLQARDQSQKQALADAHWKIAQNFKPGIPVIHVYNPDKSRDGWSAHSTVIDVVANDMPFLVDSIRMEINRQGFAVNLSIHPIYRVVRSKQGKIQEINPNYDQAADGEPEAFIHMEIERQGDADVLKELENGVGNVLTDVRNAVADWRTMKDTLKATIESFDKQTLPLPADEVTEARAFLEWLGNNHFTFIGCRNYEFVKEGDQEVLLVVPDSGLGILRDPKRRTLSTNYALMPPEVREHIKASELIVISKATARSTIHRPGFLDYIGVKQFDENGRVSGELRFLGLYTSTAYRRSPRDIPYLRDKIARVFARSKLEPVSHSGKSLMHVLETYPRDELFQISENDLYEISRGILHLGESQRVKLFLRNDRFMRYISGIVFVPRDKFSTKLRLKITEILRDKLYAKDIVFNVKLTDEAMARIEVLAMTNPEEFPRYNVAEIESLIIEESQTWEDHFKRVLHETYDEIEGDQIYKAYKDQFPIVYQADFDAQMAVVDIKQIEHLRSGSDLELKVCKPGVNQTGIFRLRVYTKGVAIAPSDALPILENMGVKVLDEVPYPIRRNGDVVWIHDYGLTYTDQKKLALDKIKDNFEDSFARVWVGQIENDGFNQLVLKAGLSWREVTIIRSYCKYLLQTKQTYSQSYMESTLAAYPEIAKMIADKFAIRFDPAYTKDREKAAKSIDKKISKAIDEVHSLDEDTILRNYVLVIDATLRTNFYQELHNQERDEFYPKAYISYKFDSSIAPDLPDPKPLFEIFVYSPRVEGIHLRGGKVARGGLRWSDRREDFRTEVLGLVKAQMVKNSVIVPLGAKGGFFVKQLPQSDDREVVSKEVQYCYTSFISGLLDVTDNIIEGEVVPPENVIRYDEDDPYLVVAADKGTATFSDLANSIAEDYGFWLGDAFASGGSNGYDHKKMGITAKGAWESVKLLFRDLGKDIQKEPFTVAGIGDMSGDVFGNGMLLSKQIKLLAAFNHMHIFLDPSPDPAKSYKERERLFKLPRSAWTDYDTKLISRGGGIYPRTAKSIPITAQVKKALGIKESSLSPNKLISAILKSPVELLWNGGIGTYIKASSEQDADAGDRTNDAVRVDANELRCQVIGEGGNLGITQRARIEFSRNGGCMDTDFIHNSGGVDCSDREVNIKILVNTLKANGVLSEKQRVKLLEDMTDDVSEFVLLDNYWQGQAITQVNAEAPRLLDEHARFMRHLEHDGLLNRAIEFLPNDEELLERKACGEGLTRPEISVLVSYSKMSLSPDLVESDLWDEPYFSNELKRYFPKILRKKYADEMEGHRLRKEILATFILNRMVNRIGPTFAYVMQEETGATYSEITRAYTIAWETFKLRELWRDIAALDNKIPGAIQTEIMLAAVKLIYRTSKWLLQHRRRTLGIEDAIETYGNGAAILAKIVPVMLEKSQDDNIKASVEHFTEHKVEKSLALHAVGMDAYYSTFDIVDIANKQELDIETVADAYFKLSAYLSCFWLRVQMDQLPVENNWQHRANAAMVDDLYRLLRNLTAEVLWFDKQSEVLAVSVQEKIEHWHQGHHLAVDRYLAMINDLRLLDQIDYSMLSVSLRELQNMLQA